MSKQVSVTVRRVVKKAGGEYGEGHVVQELRDSNRWVNVSQFYGHITSAYAALGRLTNDEIQKELNNV
jgi:hypothetical protein